MGWSSPPLMLKPRPEVIKTRKTCVIIIFIKYNIEWL